MNMRLKILEFVLWSEHIAYEKGGMTYQLNSRADYLPQVMEQQDLDMMFMMMTNIVQTSTELLCCGLHAELLAKEAFDIADGDAKIILKDIVSRKKQFLPAFVEALHQ